MRGVVKRFVGDRGFGFIRPDGASSDIFFHIRAFVALLPGATPSAGDEVEFDVVGDPASGKLKALNVRPI
jgi:cold shock protein